MRNLAAVFFSFIFLSVTAQPTENLKLEWNAYYDLSWNDFQGQAPMESHGDAGTAVQIKAKPFYVKDEVHYDVIAYFNREQSWVRDGSSQLLRHEQLHFDIAELYARKIRKEITRLKDNGVNDVQTINKAVRILLAESDKMDIQYDAETLHGSFLKKQAKWEARVKQEMGELEPFRKTKRVVRTAVPKKRSGLFAKL
jgi:hypothetical protein